MSVSSGLAVGVIEFHSHKTILEPGSFVRIEFLVKYIINAQRYGLTMKVQITVKRHMEDIVQPGISW